MNIKEQLSKMDAVVSKGAIVDADVHKRLKTAFYQKEVRNSIATGIADMEVNKGLPIEEADREMRSKLGFPPRTAS